MGDAGSMFMGLTVIWLLTLGTQGETASFHPVTALWIIAIPLMDMFAIMFRRIRNGASPFKADNGHLHHILMKLGFSSRKTLLLISFLAIIISAIGIVAEIYHVSESLMLGWYFVLFIAYVFICAKLVKLAK